ncbi:hypothetical protein [Nocardia terpenica]|nr:hypothetical protein [Nocardia terpenica]
MAGRSGADTHAGAGAPAPAWVSAPDLPAIDRTLDSPSVRRLAESFLRSQDPARAAAGNTAIRRSGTPVTVYATNPGFVADPAAPLDRAGVASYIAVPVRISDRVQAIPAITGRFAETSSTTFVIENGAPPRHRSDADPPAGRHRNDAGGERRSR